MSNVSHFETLTTRYVLIQEKAATLISDLRRLVQLLEANIATEEEHTGIFDPTSSSYAVSARALRARRDNLVATISRLERERVVDFH